MTDPTADTLPEGLAGAALPETAVVTDNARRYGRGHRPDRAAKMKDGTHLLGANRWLRSDELPDYAGSAELFRALIPGSARDQKRTSRCWGFTHREALTIYAGAQLGSQELLSANSAYNSALAMLRKLTLEVGGHVMTVEDVRNNPLQDTGSEPTAGVMGLAQMGIASEEAWPSSDDPASMLAEENLAEAEDAVSRRIITVGDFGMIPSALGKDRILAVRQALAPFPDGTKGRMVPHSIASSTQNFENADGTRVLTAADFGPSGGWDHSVGYLMYRPSRTRPGEFEFLEPNHWGLDYAPDCLVEVLDDAGRPTGAVVRMPGCNWVDESAVNAAADLFLMTAIRRGQ